MTGQSADIVDLTARLGGQSAAVTRLEAEVADLRAKAAAQPGDPGVAAGTSPAPRPRCGGRKTRARGRSIESIWRRCGSP